MASGIYLIVGPNSTMYIGSSQNIKTRWNAHKSLLARGVHANKHLQATYNKYGREALHFQVIEETDNLEVRETFWLDLCKRIGYRMYNMAVVVGAPMRGRKHSEETIEKKRQSARVNRERFAVNRKYEPVFISPTGEVVRPNTLAEMAEQYGLNRRCLSYVLSGKYKEHRGWKAAGGVS